MTIINGRHSPATRFAYDGCHKIFLLDQGEHDEQGPLAYMFAQDNDPRNPGYTIHPISQLEQIWERSCQLRFIRSWDDSTTYVSQFQKAVIRQDDDKPTIRTLLATGIHVKATAVDIRTNQDDGTQLIARLADQPLATLPDRILDSPIDTIGADPSGRLRITIADNRRQ